MAPGDEEGMPRRDWEAVPECTHQVILVEHSVGGQRVTERAADFRHAPPLVGLMILSTIRRPSNPAPTQAAQRHRLTGREDVRVIWQTGHRCSYRVDCVFRAAVG